MSSKITSLLTVLACLASGWMSAAETREFLLANGDRISGQVIAENEDSITLQHPLLGTVQLARTALAASAETPVTEAVTAPVVENTPAPVLEKEVLPFLTLPQHWKGEIGLGNAWQSGRSKKVSWDLRGQLTVDHAPNEYQYSAFYRYEETDNAVSNDRWGLGFRYRRDLSTHTFIQAQTTYDADTLKGINNQVIQGLGYGFRLIERPSFHINLVPGIAVEYLDQKNRKSETNFLLVLNQDMEWQINERFALKQNFNFHINPESSREYRFLFKSGIVGDITQTLKLNLSYEYEYDHGLAVGIKKYDSRLTSALVLAF